MSPALVVVVGLLFVVSLFVVRLFLVKQFVVGSIFEPGLVVFSN
jgi:hypothetical protein